MRKSLQQIIGILFFCFSSFLFSQNQAVVDSLTNKLSVEKNDSTKAILLGKLFSQYILYDIEKAKYYNDMQFELAEKSGDNYVYCSAYFVKGVYDYYTSDFDNTVKSMNNALAYAEKNNYSDMLIGTHGRLSSVFLRLSKKDSALYHIDKTIELSKKYDDTFNYGNALFTKGNIFSKEEKLDEALQYFLAADSVLSRLETKSNPGLSAALGNITRIYIKLENYDKAEYYGLRSKKTAEEVGHIGSVMTAERFLGEINLYKKQYKEAEEKFVKLLEYYVSVKNKSDEADLLFLLGRTNILQEKFQEAKTYYIRAVELKKEISDISGGELGALQDLGHLFLKEKNYSESKKYYTEALETARKVNRLQIEVNALKRLGEISYLTNNYKESSEYYQAYIPLQDSLTKTKNFEKVNEIEARYQTAKKEQQIELLSAENELAEQKRKSQFTVFASLIGLLLIVGLALAFAYRNKMKTAQKVRELNQMKSRFFANLSHEFRTPLTLIKSPLQNLQATLSDEKQQKQLAYIDKSSDRMLELVNQLLELSKIDSGKLNLLLKEGNISLFLKSVTEPFEYQAKEKNLKFSSTVEKSSKMYSYDKDVIEKIVTNLLSNAVKYTPENHEIRFTSNIENETLKLNVSNSGTDLKNKDLPKLFERFYQNDEQQEGFGIGLALVKELVDLYKGKIETSLNDDILNFEVTLPLTKNESENIVIQKESLTTDEIQNTEAESDNELPVLLIVDDNAEIRNVLKDIFSESYIVLEAENGKTALKLAQKEIPDCIISDVMMSEMDGFQFTQAIKENELTSFIPVILLTAKSSDEARLESLKNKAEVFLTKPFNNEILRETVICQIAERRKLREFYSRELILRPVDIAINTVDEKFLEKLGAVMEKHLSNPEFSTNEFASEIGMSRMQLHRKLKSLLNVSATEFIRNERLKTAAELMKKGNKNVSEIAYTVGFNDVSYFSRCFKEIYNVTPSEYISDMA